MLSIENIIYLAFIIINIYIIYNDFKYKIIKNKHILILLIIFICYFFYIIFTNNFAYLDFFAYFLGVFVFSFLLYYYNLWAGGDTKYFFMLCLFVYYFSGFFDYLINFSFLLIFYIVFSVLFHYIKVFFSIKKIKHFFDYSYYLFKEKYLFIFFDKGNEETIKDLNKKNVFIVNLINYITLVIFIFILIRVVRIFVVDNVDFSVYKEYYKDDFFSLLNDYGVFIILGLIGIIYSIIKIIGFIISYIKEKFKSKKEISKNNYFRGKIIKSFVFLALNFGTVFAFYFITGPEIFSSLYVFFIKFITFTLFIKLLIYLFKVYFELYEEKEIKIDELQKGDYVNYDFLDKKIGNIYEYVEENNSSKIYNPLKAAINPVNNSVIMEIKELIKNYNDYHIKKNTINFEELKIIKIINTFAFSLFLYIGFLITIITNSNFVELAIKFFK